jgi:Transposase DDE domain./Transposase domain (DUF772).
MFGTVDTLLGKSQKKAYLESRERWFYELVFKRIDEKGFAPLYSEGKSRPNAPINCMVGAMILQSTQRWSYEFLMRQVRFDLLTRAALGLSSLDEVPFCEATLFNFQNRLIEYEVATGVHLIEQVFDGLTAEQLAILKIKTDLQRCDSLQIESNIRTYSRIQLLIEVVLRVYRLLSEDDKRRFVSVVSPYTGKTSGQYVYKVEQANFSKELEQLAGVYQALRETVQTRYGETDIARIFDRVFEEHFTVTNDTISVKAPEALHSGCLQSPDDEDATYRKKRGIGYRGHILTATETCNPENEVQLITDVHVTANNRDDSDELHDRLDGIKEKTPDIEILYTDGGYGSEKNDEKMGILEIKQIQTAIKGRESAVDITITKSEDGSYEVGCPYQVAEVCQTRKRWKAIMSGKVCGTCPMRDTCPSHARRSCRVVYFDAQDVLRQKRQRNIRALPTEMRKLRANVEATMREFSRRTEGGKLKVRGMFKAQLFALTTAIGINFGRVYRYSEG